MNQSNVNRNRFSTNRIFSIIFFLIAATMLYFGLLSDDYTFGYQIVFIIAGLALIFMSLKISISLAQAKRLMIVIDKNNELSLDQFAQSMNCSTEAAKKMIVTTLKAQFLIGYFDEETQMIILKSSKRFDKQKYRSWYHVQDDVRPSVKEKKSLEREMNEAEETEQTDTTQE